MSDERRKDGRKERLARQLRANLARRKAQARAKRAGDEDSRPEGLPTARADGDSPDRDSEAE